MVVGFLNLVVSMLPKRILRTMMVTSDLSQIDNRTICKIILSHIGYCVKVAETDLKLVLRPNYSKKPRTILEIRLTLF